jgi:hypothetical protein
MNVLRSMMVLAAVCLCIAFAYFFGHGLAIHSVRPMIYGFALLVAGAAIMVVLSRRDRDARHDRGEWV